MFKNQKNIKIALEKSTKANVAIGIEIRELNDRKDLFSTQLERNLKGIDYEKEGKIEKAIDLYELNVNEGFLGSHPYKRLAVIYHKNNDIQNEIEVLKKAVLVFDSIPNTRGDKKEKLEYFENRLKKLISDF